MYVIYTYIYIYTYMHYIYKNISWMYIQFRRGGWTTEPGLNFDQENPSPLICHQILVTKMSAMFLPA